MIDRVQELNGFMSFIVSRPELFNAISVHKFFDINVPDTKAGEIIEKYSLQNYSRIAERLGEFYTDFVNVS